MSHSQIELWETLAGSHRARSEEFGVGSSLSSVAAASRLRVGVPCAMAEKELGKVKKPGSHYPCAIVHSDSAGDWRSIYVNPLKPRLPCRVRWRHTAQRP